MRLNFKYDYIEESKEKKKNPCWKGYKKVKGKADYSENSCVKEATFDPDKPDSISKDFTRKYRNEILRRKKMDSPERQSAEKSFSKSSTSRTSKKTPERAMMKKPKDNSKGYLSRALYTGAVMQ